MQEKTNEQVVEQKKYVYGGGKEEAGKNRLISIGFTVALSIAFFVVGSHTCVGIGKDYIYLSWFTCLLPLVGCWLAVIKLLRYKEELTEKDVKTGPGRMWRSSVIIAVASGVALVGSVWFLIDGTYIAFSMELGLVIRMAILCALAVVSTKCHKKQEARLVQIQDEV